MSTPKFNMEKKTFFKIDEHLHYKMAFEDNPEAFVCDLNELLKKYDSKARYLVCDETGRMDLMMWEVPNYKEIKNPYLSVHKEEVIFEPVSDRDDNIKMLLDFVDLDIERHIIDKLLMIFDLEKERGKDITLAQMRELKKRCHSK